MNSIKEYFDIIESFVGYDIVPRITANTGQLFIRHDVDFDLGLAVRLAEKEYERNIKAVYFIMVTSRYYNSLNHGVFKILELGHDVLLHYDHRFDFQFQLDSFEGLMGYCPNLVSMHRPLRLSELHIDPIRKIESTYSDRYSKDAKYFPDSNCLWRYGYPAPQEEWRAVQLLTHPVWWMIEGDSESEKCDNFMVYRQKKLKEELHKSLRTYV